MATRGTIVFTSPALAGTRPLIPSAKYTTFSMTRYSGNWPTTRYKIVEAYVSCSIYKDGSDVITVKANGVSIGVFGISKAGRVSGSMSTSFDYAKLETLSLHGNAQDCRLAADYVNITVVWELDQVGSTFTLSRSSLAAGENVTLTVNPYRDSYGHRWTLSFGDYETSGVMQPGEKTASLTVPMTWLRAIPDAASGIAMVRVQTWEDSTANCFAAATRTLTVTVPNSAAPQVGACSIAPLLTVGGETFPEVVPGGFVQWKCGYQVRITGAAGQYGASIIRYDVSGVGYSGTGAAFSSGVLMRSGEQQITCKVTDSRGLTAATVLTITILPYRAPRTAALTAWRVDDQGQPDPMGTKGQWAAEAQFSDLGGKNTLTTQQYLQAVDGTEVPLGLVAAEDGNYWLANAAGELLELPVTARYTLHRVLTDGYGAVECVTELPSANFAMHFNADGSGICFGGASTRKNAVEIAGGRALWLGGYRITPRAGSLVDNGDFTKAVNQRGETSYASASTRVYTIDRWFFEGEGCSLTMQGEAVKQVTLGPKGGRWAQSIEQPERYAGKMLTYAIYVEGEPEGAELRMILQTSMVQGKATLHAGLNVLSHLVPADVASVRVVVQNNGTTRNGSFQPVWAALYEGEYTEGTLPPFVPKGPAAELAACRRFYQRGVYSGTFGTQYASKLKGMFPLVISGMRIKPTLTLKEVRTQGWDTITLADLSVGWNRLYGNDVYFNIFAGDNADIVGQAASICYEASADI